MQFRLFAIDNGLDVFEVVLGLIARHVDLADEDFLGMNQHSPTRDVIAHRTLFQSE